MDKRFIVPVAFTAIVGLVLAVRAQVPTPAVPFDGASAQTDTVLHATLTGAEQVERPGSPRGFGTVTVTPKRASSEVCYDLKIRYIVATNAHIHKAPKGQNGPAVVPFMAPADSTSAGCAQVDAGIVADLLANPTSYYVNVHTAEFPQGAIRGQLARVSRSAVP